jgi:hypothetical protein
VGTNASLEFRIRGHELWEDFTPVPDGRDEDEGDTVRQSRTLIAP